MKLSATGKGYPVVPRAFGLFRNGAYVAYGVLWNNGEVAVHWEGDKASTVVWRSLDDALAVHNTHDETELVWL